MSYYELHTTYITQFSILYNSYSISWTLTKAYHSGPSFTQVSFIKLTYNQLEMQVIASIHQFVSSDKHVFGFVSPQVSPFKIQWVEH